MIETTIETSTNNCTQYVKRQKALPVVDLCRGTGIFVPFCLTMTVLY